MRWAVINLLWVLFGGCSTQPFVASEWVYSEEADDNRGTQMRTAVLESDTIYNDGSSAEVSMALALIQMHSGKQGAMLLLRGDRFDCPDNNCLLRIKFDESEVNEHELALRRWEHFIGPHFNRVEFLGSINLASRLTIEVPLVKSGRQTFAFNVGNAPINAVPKPAKVLSVAFGSSPAEFKDLKEPRIGRRGGTCFRTDNKNVLALEGIEGVGSVCFFQERFYAAVLHTPNEKASLSAAVISAHLDQVFRTKTAHQNRVQWPGFEDNDGTHTKSADVFLNEKSAIFVIKDHSVFPLLPEEKYDAEKP